MMKQIIDYKDLPDEAFMPWMSCASMLVGNSDKNSNVVYRGSYERTTLPFVDRGYAQREYGEWRKLVYYEDDYVVFDVRKK